MSNNHPQPTALVQFLGDGDEGTDAWVRMHKLDRSDRCRLVGWFLQGCDNDL